MVKLFKIGSIVILAVIYLFTLHILLIQKASIWQIIFVMFFGIIIGILMVRNFSKKLSAKIKYETQFTGTSERSSDENVNVTGSEYMSYYEILKNKKISNIAPYWKRFLSGVIDLFIIWGYFILLVKIFSFKFSLLWILTFAFSVAYQFISYMLFEKTIGNMIVKIKPVFVKGD